MKGDSAIKIISLSPSAERVDSFLARELSKISIEFSRSKVQKLISVGNITYCGHIVKASENVLAGEYSVTPLPSANHNIIPFEFTLDIVYEDEELAVVNKPAGLTVHPANDYHHDTLVNALVKHFGENLSSVNGIFKPGIVHRLDRDTSGLMVVAKTDASHIHLSKQLEDRSLSRVYIACCFGRPLNNEGIIQTYIDRMRSDRTKMVVTKSSGREAITHYKVLESNGCFSVIECRLKTGRTHQIRVHLSHIGHSIIGDQTYGHNKRKLEELAKHGYKISMQRQALHSKSISFIHPKTGDELSFTSDLPEDMQEIIRLL